MLKFDRQGLIPAVIQDDATGEVLMVAFMNEEALRLTRATGYTHFYSRSRNTTWRKGEQSGNFQEVRAIFINCEENSLLIRVVQHGGAACHMGYRSCYYRRLLPDGSYETVAERVFDPDVVYGTFGQEGNHKSPHPTHLYPCPYHEGDHQAGQSIAPLESGMRQLYAAYLYLRDHDLSEQSNTSRLLHESLAPLASAMSAPTRYLVSRLADELQELAGVQLGEHLHSGRQQDTILEGSQVGYWLFLLAAISGLQYDDFMPHISMMRGYSEQYSAEQLSEQREKCLSLLAAADPSLVTQGLQVGFALIGRACAGAGISPADPVEFDLEQMRRKGLL